MFDDIINDNELFIVHCDCTYINYDRHMIVHMTELYTRLVTYARLYILTLVVSFYHIGYILFISLFLILIILLFFI